MINKNINKYEKEEDDNDEEEEEEEDCHVSRIHIRQHHIQFSMETSFRPSKSWTTQHFTVLQIIFSCKSRHD